MTLHFHINIAARMLYYSVCTYPRTSYILKYRKILPDSSERGWAEERLNRTDSTVSTRLVQSTLTGTTAEVKCRWGKICNNIRGLCIHQGRMACGSTAKQRQRSDFMSGETLEDPIQVTTHSTGNLLLAADEPCTNSHEPDMESQADVVFDKDDPLLELLRTQEELTVPCETTCEAYERKMAKYTELQEQCGRRGWSTWL